MFLNSREGDSEKILSELKRLGIHEDQLLRAEKHLRRSDYNSGMTYSAPDARESVLVVGQATSVEETMDTFSHELRHLVDDIALACGIQISGEEVAYLTGDIAFAVATALLHIVCE